MCECASAAPLIGCRWPLRRRTNSCASGRWRRRASRRGCGTLPRSLHAMRCSEKRRRGAKCAARGRASPLHCCPCPPSHARAQFLLWFKLQLDRNQSDASKWLERQPPPTLHDRSSADVVTRAAIDALLHVFHEAMEVRVLILGAVRVGVCCAWSQELARVEAIRAEAEEKAVRRREQELAEREVRVRVCLWLCA